MSQSKKILQMVPDFPNEEDIRLLHDLPDMVWRSGPDSKFNYFNQSWLSFTGRSLEQEMGEGWLEGVHPQDLETFLQVYRAAFRQRKPFETEYRLRHRNGEYRWVRHVGRPTADAEGQWTGFIGTCFDLTERKQLEKALQESQQAMESANAALRASEAMFKGLFEFAPDAVIAVDSEGKILLANQQAQNLFGYSSEELIGQPVEMLMPDAFQEAHRKHVNRFAQHPRQRPMGTGLPLVGQHKDGRRFPLDINLGPLKIDERFIVLATIRNISERQKAEEALRERETMLSTAVTAAPLAFFKVDAQGIIQLSLGRSLARQIKQQNPVGKSIYEVYQETPEAIHGFQRALAGETFTTVIESDGWIYETSYTPLHNEQGEINAVVGVASDVTRHRQVEDALVESEAHFRTVFENAILGILLVDPQGQIIESNTALQSMLGYNAEELRQVNYIDLLHPREVSMAKSWMEKLISGQVEHFQVEQRYKHHDGKLVWARLAMSLFRGQDGSPLYGIGMVENITAQKQAEAELAELRRRLIDSSELERLQLSQELHDGPLQDLQAISFQIAMLETLVSSDEGVQEVQSLHEEMSKVTRAIRAICGDLRPPALAPFGLEKAIRSHAERFQDQHPEIRLHLDLMADNQNLSERVRLALFRIYQQSMTNILRHSHAKNVWVSFNFDADWIRLRIADDGAGFKVPSRWIEFVRQGHFGLVGSIERAESVGGKFEVQSSVGEGAVIEVTVPRREEEQVTAQERFSARSLNDRSLNDRSPNDR